MNPKDDPIWRDYEKQIDRNLQDRHRDINLWGEIGSKGEHDETSDSQSLINRRVGTAEANLYWAFKGKRSFTDVLDETDEVLKLDPENAVALTLRAIAYSQLGAFPDAIADAEAAMRIQPNDDSERGQWMRNQLPAWRNA